MILLQFYLFHVCLRLCYSENVVVRGQLAGQTSFLPLCVCMGIELRWSGLAAGAVIQLLTYVTRPILTLIPELYLLCHCLKNRVFKCLQTLSKLFRISVMWNLLFFILFNWCLVSLRLALKLLHSQG